VITYIKHLRRHLRRKLLIIWDGVAIHRAKLLTQYLSDLKGEVICYRLPAYAPELNPAEYIFGYLKEHKLGNYCPDSVAELKRTASKALASMRKRKRLIPSFWKAAKLCQ